METYAPCPQCNASAAQKVNFTWWGGVLGPRVLKHVKCGSCGKGYNGKTGKDNLNGIIIYSVVVGMIALGLVVVMFAAAVMVIFVSGR